MRRRWAGRTILLMTVAALLSAAAVSSGAGKRGTIDTIAGTGVAGYSGDGGPARRGRISEPHSIAVDRRGNVYISLLADHVVRKVDRNGTITTFAGTGTAGFSGDGGPARNAQLEFPDGLAVDRRGNLYIADRGNYRIRKVSRRGKITTFAGTGKLPNIFDDNPDGDGGPARKARLFGISGLTADSQGNLYMAGGGTIRKINRKGTISTIAGSTPGYAGDGGPAKKAKLGAIGQIAADRRGNLYVTDYTVDRIRKISTNGRITTFAGTGTAGFSGDGGRATNARLDNPIGVTVDGKGSVYVADNANCRVRKVDRQGKIATIVGRGCGVGVPGGGDGGPAKDVRIIAVTGLAIDRDGNVLIADSNHYRVRIVHRVAAPMR